MNYRIRKIQFILLFLFLNTACSTTYTLVNTPNIYLNEQGYPNRNITESMQTVTPEILFITDRKLNTIVDEKASYGTERSASMAFGKAKITFGNGITWDDLKRESGKEDREKDLQLSVSKITELVRFPKTPLPFFIKDNALVTAPLIEAEYHQASQLVKNHIQSSLRDTASKDVILFIHGFNNDFDDAAISLANIWHFTGRNTVPVFFTWPAASGGLFGYFKDRRRVNLVFST